MSFCLLKKGFVFLIILTLFCVTITSAFGIIQTSTFTNKSVDLSKNNEEENILDNFIKIDTIMNRSEDIANILEYSRYFQSNEEIFEKLIMKLMNSSHMSALSAAIIKDNKCIWAKGYGLYDRENNKKNNEEIIFLAASISKTFAATALMQLYEKGYFDLDDDVNNYLPFSLRNPSYPEISITYRMLFSHQSSLATDREDLPNFLTRIYPGGLKIEGYPYPFLKDYLTTNGNNYRPQVWANSAPGEEMHYANIGYGLMGYLVEILSNMSFEEYCYENIFKPLDMYNSSFSYSNLDSKRIGIPYEFISGEYCPIIHYDLLDSPAGGLRTSVIDLSHFLIANMNNGVYGDIRLLNEESISEMHSIQYPRENGYQYGLGFQIWEKPTDTYIGHTGGLYGVATKMVFRSSDNIGIIFFTNKEIWNNYEIVAFSLIERLLFWKANGFSNNELQLILLENTIESNEHLNTNPGSCDN